MWTVSLPLSQSNHLTPYISLPLSHSYCRTLTVSQTHFHCLTISFLLSHRSKISLSYSRCPTTTVEFYLTVSLPRSQSHHLIPNISLPLSHSYFLTWHGVLHLHLVHLRSNMLRNSLCSFLVLHLRSTYTMNGCTATTLHLLCLVCSGLNCIKISTSF